MGLKTPRDKIWKGGHVYSVLKRYKGHVYKKDNITNNISDVEISKFKVTFEREL